MTKYDLDVMLLELGENKNEEARLHFTHTLMDTLILIFSHDLGIFLNDKRIDGFIGFEPQPASQ